MHHDWNAGSLRFFSPPLLSGKTSSHTLLIAHYRPKPITDCCLISFCSHTRPKTRTGNFLHPVHARCFTANENSGLIRFPSSSLRCSWTDWSHWLIVIPPVFECCFEAFDLQFARNKSIFGTFLSLRPLNLMTAC
jgi:hypothetical protein